MGTKLKSCPSCGGDVLIYRKAWIVEGNNCFVKCQKCRQKYTLDVRLDGHDARDYWASVRKAERLWNTRSSQGLGV